MRRRSMTARRSNWCSRLRAMIRNFLFIAIISLASMAQAANVSEPTPESLLNAGRVDEAISALSQQLIQKANEAQTRHLLSRAYFSLGNYDAAIRESERAVALAPNNAAYHLWLGRAYGRKAEHANWFTAAGLAGKMRDQFEKSVQLNGDDIAARTDLAE